MTDLVFPVIPADEDRLVRFTPGWHRCDPDPAKSYGINNLSILWIVRSGGWAITWEVFTDWGLPKDVFKAQAPDCDHRMHQDGPPPIKPMGGMVAWLSPDPFWPGQEPGHQQCPIIGTSCYQVTGGLVGFNLFELLRTDGDLPVWARLRELLDDRRAMTNDKENDG